MKTGSGHIDGQLSGATEDEVFKFIDQLGAL